MTCTAVFAVRVAPPTGAYLRHDFQPPPLEFSGSLGTVRVVPEVRTEVQQLLDADHPEQAPEIEREDLLVELKVEIDHEPDTIPPSVELRRKLNSEAERVLRPILYRIRASTGNTNVDVRLATLSLVQYLDKEGQDLHRMPGFYWWTELPWPDLFHAEIDETIWSRAQEDVLNSSKPCLEEEWLLDALSFREQAIYELAAFAAAVSLEISLKQIVIHWLAQALGMAREKAESIVNRMNLPMIRNMLESGGVITTGQAEAADEAAKLRNRIAHGDDRVVTEEQATSSIKVARELRDLFASLVGDAPTGGWELMA